MGKYFPKREIYFPAAVFCNNNFCLEKYNFIYVKNFSHFLFPVFSEKPVFFFT